MTELALVIRAAARWTRVLLLSAATSAGCGVSDAQVTEVVVDIDAEDAVAAATDALQLRVEGSASFDTLASSRLTRHDNVIDAKFPLRIGLVPLKGDVRRAFVISVSALQDGQIVAEARLAGGYVAGEVRFAQLLLRDSCRGVSCDALQTCTESACDSAQVDVAELPDADPRPEDSIATMVEASTGARAECTAEQTRCASTGACIPDGGCCSSADCPRNTAGQEGMCRDGECLVVCQLGYKACAGESACISADGCCSAEDCTAGVANQQSTCVSGQCDYTCQSGHHSCPGETTCRPEGSCCSAADCPEAGPGQHGACSDGACTYECDSGYRQCPGAETCTPVSGCCTAEDCGDGLLSQEATGQCKAGSCSYAFIDNWVDGGRDDYGDWAAFDLAGVRVRMRYIPAGSFIMGSPPSEPGRNYWDPEQRAWFKEQDAAGTRESDEPQHMVTLTRSYWYAETETTQALWEAVMGNNPSRFVSPERPVENVAWSDIGDFVKQTEQLQAGLGLRLPTEAEWEYATRAGTATATYMGNADILGLNHAPLLDGIAWYGGNSGVDFELTGLTGWNCSGWLERQYDATNRCGTHPVGLKAPNARGLFDTLGNVFEWTADWYLRTYYESSPAVDPSGPTEGTYHVYRGGAFNSWATTLRAAYRSANAERDEGFDNQGFRLARDLK